MLDRSLFVPLNEPWNHSGSKISQNVSFYNTFKFILYFALKKFFFQKVEKYVIWKFQWDFFGEFSNTMSERFVPFSTLPISLKAIKEKNGLYNREDLAFKSKSSGKMDILI